MAASLNAYSGSVPEKYDRYLGPLLFEPFARDLAARIDPTLSGMYWKWKKPRGSIGRKGVQKIRFSGEIRCA